MLLESVRLSKIIFKTIKKFYFFNILYDVILILKINFKKYIKKILECTVSNCKSEAFTTAKWNYK
jgi:hypothetical protein